MTDDYAAFLERKRQLGGEYGFDPIELPAFLFPFQRDLVTWALRKGRAAIFADTGLGKTPMQLAWADNVARYTSGSVLIVAPLAVCHQTVREGEKFGITVRYAKHDSDDVDSAIVITNYERLPGWDVDSFAGVVLDESSILKNYAGKMRTAIIETFASTPYRLACTATPAPNDIAELANHAEFLGVQTRTGMLATYFVHDDNGWRLKRPARGAFFSWLAHWGMHIRRPSDLGYDDDGFALPGLSIEAQIVESDEAPPGMLFAVGMSGGIGGRSKMRKATLAARCERAAALVLAEPGERWIVWCGLNDEARMMTDLIPGAVNVEGADDPEYKAATLLAFSRGDVPVLVTKVEIAGFGMNLQVCARQVFVGLDDSYERYYQAIRRSWRFGQENDVVCHIVLSDAEQEVYDNVLRKEREARMVGDELIANVANYERTELGTAATDGDWYEEAVTNGNGWTMMLGDSAARMAELADDSVDLSVFSPPFLSLYQYTDSPRDLGNSKDDGTFWDHFDYIGRELLRVTKPGRNACVHLAQFPTTLANHGVIGLRDFRGDAIRYFQGCGFIYHGEVLIDKNPQAQAIRTHAKALLFVQKNKDSSWSRPGLADYILIFKKPGENAIPITPDVSNNEWVEWAHPVWYGLRESDTLNAAEGRDAEDERHICPLQLPVIERCVRLWSNRGETVFSPFAGIGSEGYEAVRLGRRFVGIELKPSYYRTACKNLGRAEHMVLGDLFAYAETVGDS